MWKSAVRREGLGLGLLNTACQHRHDSFVVVHLSPIETFGSHTFFQSWHDCVIVTAQWISRVAFSGQDDRRTMCSPGLLPHCTLLCVHCVQDDAETLPGGPGLLCASHPARPEERGGRPSDHRRATLPGDHLHRYFQKASSHTKVLVALSTLYAMTGYRICSGNVSFRACHILCMQCKRCYWRQH